MSTRNLGYSAYAKRRTELRILSLLEKYAFFRGFQPIFGRTL
jgi:hypothetical protein